jgi:hypothetical protein
VQPCIAPPSQLLPQSHSLSSCNKAPLDKVKLSSIVVRITGCSGSQVGAEGNLVAGILRMVKGRPNRRRIKVTVLGAPKGVELQVIPEAGSWPPADKSCIFKLASTVASGKARAFEYGVCAPALPQVPGFHGVFVRRRRRQAQGAGARHRRSQQSRVRCQRVV